MTQKPLPRQTAETLRDQAATEELSDTERRIKWLENELSMLTKAGIIEVAVRNPSVAEYMKHWEGRAEKAEAALSTAEETGRRKGLEEAAQVADKRMQRYPKTSHARGAHAAATGISKDIRAMIAPPTQGKG